MAFHFELEKLAPFKRVVSSLAAFVKECVFEVNTKGVSVTSLTASKNCAVELLMPAQMFKLFKCDETGDAIGLDVTTLDRLLRTLHDQSFAGFKCKDNGDKVNLYVKSQRDQASHSVDLQVLNLDYDGYKVPEIDPCVTAVLDSKYFKETMSRMKLIGDNIKIWAKNDQLKFVAQGEQRWRTLLEKEENPDNNSLLGLIIHREASAHYDLEYVLKMTQSVQANEVKLEFVDNGLLVVTYEMGYGGYMAYKIGARVFGDGSQGIQSSQGSEEGTQ